MCIHNINDKVKYLSLMTFQFIFLFIYKLYKMCELANIVYYINIKQY